MSAYTRLLKVPGDYSTIGEALSAAKKNSTNSYKRALLEYKSGIGTSTNLLLSQRQMLSVSSQVLELERMRLENRINLHLSLGGTAKKQ